MSAKVVVSVRLDPKKLERLDQIVPPRHRSAFIQKVIDEAIEKAETVAKRQRRFTRTIVRENILNPSV